MKISFADHALPDGGSIVVFAAGESLLASARALDERSGGLLSRAAKAARFEGKADTVLDLILPAGLPHDRILLVGIGDAAKLTASAAESLGAGLQAGLTGKGVSEAVVMVDPVEGAPLPLTEFAALMGHGARLRGFTFTRYKTKTKKDKEKDKILDRLTFSVAAADAAKKQFKALDAVADGVFLARELVTEPPNVLTPVEMADRAQKALEDLGVKVKVLDKKDMKKLGMGALLGVGQGSVNESRLVSMEWQGDPDAADQAPLAFIGKGITFDTGGISIKPAGGMEDMKWDMAGAGAVIGLMAALAGRKAKVNAVGIVALAENMPGGNAQRPSDIVTSASGQTIEVLNTDAEGRLVLADALWYAKTEFKPQLMIDLATLTGAIIVALGSEQAGLFSNDDALASRLTQAGAATGEKLWRMPIGDAYDKEIDSDIADMKNIAAGREAGSTIGAVFLQRFVDGCPWAHLDIAGVAWSKKDKGPVPKGATAFGVRLLNRFVADSYEG